MVVLIPKTYVERSKGSSFRPKGSRSPPGRHRAFLVLHSGIVSCWSVVSLERPVSSPFPRSTHCRWTMFLFGLSDGLTFFTLTAVQFYRLASYGVSPKRIGLFAWTGLPYNLRFFVQFIVDRVKVPFLSRRYSSQKAWGLVAHLGSTVGFCFLGLCDARSHWLLYLAVAFLTSLFAAMQSVITAAYQFSFERILPFESSVPVKTLGFRVGLFFAATVLPLLANYEGWFLAHIWISVIKIAAFVILISLPDEKDRPKRTRTQKSSSEQAPRFVEIFTAFLKKPFTLPFLASIFLLKGIETVLGPMQTEFLGSLGVSLQQFSLRKNALGFVPMLLGVLLARQLAVKMNAYKALLFAALGQSLVALLSLPLLHASAEHFNTCLMGVSLAQEFAQGMATTLLALNLSLFSDRSLSVYHFTLLSTIGSLARVFWTTGYNFALEALSWSLLFCLPLGLYAGLFLISTTLSREKSFWQIFGQKDARG